MHYCMHCGHAYEPMAYAALAMSNLRRDGRVLCPVKNCRRDLVELDENIYPLLKSLYDAGIPAMFSCIGHEWEIRRNAVDIYISVDTDHRLENASLIEAFVSECEAMSSDSRYGFLNVDRRPEGSYGYYDLEGEFQETDSAAKIYADRPPARYGIGPAEAYAMLLRRQADFVEAVERALIAAKKKIAEGGD